MINFNGYNNCISDARNQTLANLANFAYDPINYDYIKQLHLIDLFLAQLSEASEELIHFSLAGICNLCCGKLFFLVHL